jgi:hypothetical protein
VPKRRMSSGGPHTQSLMRLSMASMECMGKDIPGHGPEGPPAPFRMKT